MRLVSFVYAIASGQHRGRREPLDDSNILPIVNTDSDIIDDTDED